MANGVKRIDRGKGHSYYLLDERGKQGAKLDGVTTLINDGLAKPALINWAGNTTAAYAVDHWAELETMSVSERLDTLKGARFADRDAAAARGTQVHELAEQILAGAEVDVPEEIAGHVESAVRFLDDWAIDPILTETVVYNVTAGYAGTLDLVATTDKRPGEVWILDWKTSRSGIFSEAALQLAAYRNAEFYLGRDGEDHPVPDLGITHAYGVHVRADGYSLLPLDTGPRAFESFRYIATVARRARQWKDEPLVGREIHLEDVA